jgi:hypothetical protein
VKIQDQTGNGNGGQHRISAAAWHAANTLLQFYDVQLKPGVSMRGMKADARCLAIVIDLCTNVYRASQLRPEFRYWQERMLSGTATAADIGKFFRKAGVELGYLPTYEEKDEEVKVILPG